MTTNSDNVLEVHFTLAEIAEKWKVSHDTVQRIFKDEPGVLKLGHPTLLKGRKYQCRRFTLRIPESVFLRVQNRLMHKPDASVSRPVAGRGRRGVGGLRATS